MDFSRRIIFEDNHFLIINKFSGEIVQGDKTGDVPLTDLVADFLVRRDHKPGKAFIGLSHRLDRPTSGALILAKTSKGLSRMNDLFRKGLVDKRYWALLEGVHSFPERELKHWLFRDSRSNKSVAYNEPGNGRKEARLRVKSLLSSDRFSLVEIELLTGRHHQIRAQLAAMGLHIRGDLKYGAKRSMKGGGISLHCRFMHFVHPVRNEDVNVTAPVPEEDALWAFFQGKWEELNGKG